KRLCAFIRICRSARCFLRNLEHSNHIRGICGHWPRTALVAQYSKEQKDLDPEASLYAIGIALCLVLLAFTSAVDAALTAISRHRLSVLQEESAARATVIKRLLSDPYRFKAAILLLNTATVIAATAFMLLLTYGLDLGWQVGALTLLLLLMLVFSEALPKALAIRNPSRAAALLAGPMALLAQVLWPLISLISFLTGPLIPLLSGQGAQKMPLVTEEEL